ncbi:phosphatase PAP2 family protein [Gottfriedia acidiceleris]|uniref:phosphatase PAP2 family protein n=1 Tax=Gottfriedia acidiceleris TaxID=371036 RepID=UPI002FFDF5E2
MYRMSLFHYLKPNAGSLLHFEFPNEQSFMSIVVYVFFVFVLIRHLKNDIYTRIKLITPIIVLFLLLLIGVANIYFSIQIPSDIIAGYTYGATWLFLNLLLLEILRLIQQYKTFPNKRTI